MRYYDLAGVPAQGYPVLQETVLGWTLSGKTPVATTTKNEPQHTFLLRDDFSLNNLNRFWEVEPMEQATMTAEQQACESHFITHTTQQDGRFVVRLPTKLDPKQLRSSRLSAERRLHAIERRLERDPELKLQYHKFMKEYEKLGHMELVTPQDGRQPCYFLPHHPVFKATSTTTQTRVVFDGGSKTSNGLLLNDILLWALQFNKICIPLYFGSEIIRCASQLTLQGYIDKLT